MPQSVTRRTYTDEEVTSACGLHLDNLRRLITWRAIKPAQSGGGRGRIRRWSIGQVMRIAVTAEFARVGLSLRLAHTLTYCLPLDDMLKPYDPAFIEEHVNLADPVEVHMRGLVMPELEDYWPTTDVVGSQTYIVDNSLVYSDALGDTPTLFGIIDPDKKQYHPVRWFPEHHYGMTAASIDKPTKSSLLKVDRSSLLVPPFYFKAKEWELRTRQQRLTRDIDTQIISVEDVRCRSFLWINLAAALVATFRRLHGLPVSEVNLKEVLHAR